MASGAAWACKKETVWIFFRTDSGRPHGPIGAYAQRGRGLCVWNEIRHTGAGRCESPCARKRQSGNVLEVAPEGTPTEVVEHRLPEKDLVCKICGSQMEEIGKEVHRTLKMKPPKFWIREDVYYTYKCMKCEQETGEANILKTPKEPALLPGSFVSAEAVAHIMTQKFVMYSPLYRLEQEFNRQGLKLSRQTMSNWLLNVSEMWLPPIYNVLHGKFRKEQVLHADETTLQVLKEAGRPSTSNEAFYSSGFIYKGYCVIYTWLEDPNTMASVSATIRKAEDSFEAPRYEPDMDLITERFERIGRNYLAEVLEIPVDAGFQFANIQNASGIFWNMDCCTPTGNGLRIFTSLKFDPWSRRATITPEWGGEFDAEFDMDQYDY